MAPLCCISLSISLSLERPFEQLVHEIYSWVRQIPVRKLVRIDPHLSEKFRFGVVFGSVCTRNLFLSPPNSVQNRSNLIKKVWIWCLFLISLYTNPIPESAQNRISKWFGITHKNHFLRAWRLDNLDPNQMSNTDWGLRARTDKIKQMDRQTNIILLRLTTQWALRAIRHDQKSELFCTCTPSSVNGFWLFLVENDRTAVLLTELEKQTD